MKTTSEYITLLRKYMAENASKYGIMRMGIFGSVARGEQTVESDVDVCVELQTPNMFSLVHIKEELQHLFGCAVDIVTEHNRGRRLCIKGKWLKPCWVR